MGRRSQLFSKKRASKAILSKKRKADDELPQACSTKLSRQKHLPDEEEEIGDFIVVDTGALYQPEAKSQSSKTEDEVNTVSTSRATSLPSIILVEEEEPLIKLSTELLSTESEVAKPAQNDVSVLLAEPPQTSDGITSRLHSVEPPENDIPSGAQHDPIILSPPPDIDEETSQCQTDTILEDNMNSFESLLGPTVENDEILPEDSQEMEIDSPSLLLPIVAPERSTSAALMQPCVSSTSEILLPGNFQREEPVSVDIPASESFGDAPVGVLVTTGDQCPSKFVVSGIASNLESGHQVPTQTASPVHHGLPWIETVTEGVFNKFSEGPGSKSPHSAESKSVMDSPPRISTMMPFPSEQPCRNLPGIIGAIDPQNSCHQPSLSDESKPFIQQFRNCETASKEVAQASPNFLQRQMPTDQKRQASPTETIHIHDLGSALKKLPSPVQYPSSFREETTSSRPDSLDSASNKLPNDWTTKVGFSLDIVRSDHSIEFASSVDTDIPVSTRRTSSPTLRFTSDNRAESTLTTVEVQGKIQIFVKDAVAILPGEQPTLPRTYPAGVVLWQSLQKFHKWYAREVKLETGSKARSTQTITMKFELLDVHWQPENVFYLPRKATLDEFRDLKQCIWDLFWVSATLVGEESPKPFRIRIAPAANVVDGTKLGHLTTASPPTSIRTPPAFPHPPSSQSSFDNMVRNFQDLAPNNPHRYHRHQGSRPSSLRLDSPPVTLDDGGVKTPKLLLDHLQPNANRENSQPSSIKSSPTRPESHGSSTASIRGIELLHPPLERPMSMMTTNFQPYQSSQFLNMLPFTNSIDPQRVLSPPRIFETAKVTSSDLQPDSTFFQSSHPSRALQLPAPRPSPAIRDPYPMTTLQTQPTAADNNYAANTARPMFSVQPHKAYTAPRTTLPSAPQTRVPNTSQPAPEIPPTPIAIAPRPLQDSGKEPQAETSAPGFQTSRTLREQKRFRDNAMRILSDRPTLVLDSNETTGGRKRTYPEISGVIVDKNSEMGLVQITERGYTVQQVNTGQDVYLDQYTELTMREGQVCIIHGSSTVFYYGEGKRDGGSNQLKEQRTERRPLPDKAPMRQRTQESSVPAPSRRALPTKPKTQAPSLLGQREQITVPPPPAAEIQVRLQKDAAGHFTAPHDFAFFATITTMELLFDWFARRTGHGGPFGPERLRVTLKDAMPIAKYYDLERDYGGAEFANAELQRMKEDILNEYEKTKAFMPDLKEFAVLVVDPFWVEGERNDIRQ